MKFKIIIVLLNINLTVLIVAQSLQNDTNSATKLKRLIKTDREKPAVLMTDEEVMKLIEAGISFMDITNEPDFKPKIINEAKGRALKFQIWSEPKYQPQVRQLISQSKQSRLKQFIADFSNFFDRTYNTDYGLQSQDWLTAQVKTSLQGHKGQVNTSMENLPVPDYRQENIIAKISGCDEKRKSQVIILGAHYDSITKKDKGSPSPGADDNASGSAVLLEVIRLISELGIRFKRTVEFHWYAVEEKGAVGSFALSKEYEIKKVDVKAMLNLDIVGYKETGSNDSIAIYTDYVNEGLVKFLRKLVQEYLKYKWRNVECGYGCSDHAPWNERGYPAAFVGEPKHSPFMHTKNDTIEKVDFEQILEFVKLAVSYIVEIAEPYENKIHPEYCN